MKNLNKADTPLDAVEPFKPELKSKTLDIEEAQPKPTTKVEEVQKPVGVSVVMKPKEIKQQDLPLPTLKNETAVIGKVDNLDQKGINVLEEPIVDANVKSVNEPLVGVNPEITNDIENYTEADLMKDTIADNLEVQIDKKDEILIEK